MSEHDTTTDEQEQEQQYQVTVWATPLFAQQIPDAESEEEAEEKAEARVKREEGSPDIKTVRVQDSRGGTYNVDVWATKEYVETVTAASEEAAEEAAVEEVKALHSVVDSDIDSVNAEVLGR